MYNKVQCRSFLFPIKIGKIARGIIVNKKIKGEHMTFEWKHPNYYKELKKIADKEFKDQQSEEQEDQDQTDTEDNQT